MQKRITISKITLIGLLLMTSCQSPTGPESSSSLKASYISGKVVDSTNTAISGAVIIDLGTMALKDTAKTDGTFLMAMNISSSYTTKFMAQATGYSNSDTNSVVVTPGDTTTTTIRLKTSTGAHVVGKTRAANITWSTTDNANISLYGAGQTQSSIITFLVTDTLKNPVNGATVKFSVSPFVTGGGSVLPSSAITDAYGKVSTVYSSGTASGVFKITASTNSDSVIGSTTIIVNTGLPAFMSLSLKPFNVAGLLYDNLSAGIVAILTDRNGNPVPNYPINFSSSGGTIQTSNYTQNIPFTDQNGKVNVNLISSNNRPPQLGIVTVLAQTVGDTSYLKSDSVIVRAIPVVFSGTTQIIFTTPSPLTVPDSGVVSVGYRVQDQYGNPLVAGSEYTVSVTDPTTGAAFSGITLTGDADVKMTDTQDTSKTRFTVNIIKLVRSSQGGAAKITVTVKSDPASYGNGNASSSISGYINSTSTSTGGGTTVFGANPSALSVNGSASRSISVNESSNDPNAATALSFTIKDSLGNIITNYAGSGVARPLVGFSIVRADGGYAGESVVPAIDSASNSGTVSTTFYAGTKSGIVRVFATLLGTSRPPASVDVTVSGGYPDSNHITFNLSQTNFPGFVTLSGALGSASVQMSDQFNNPARSNTPIYFTTTGGAIDPSAQTNVAGQASVTLYAGGQTPNDGGHTGNGTVKLSTFGRDSIRIVKTVPFVFSGAPIVTVTDTNLGTIGIGNSFVVNYKVADVNGNPLSSGNTISVAAGGTAGAQAGVSGDIAVTTTDTKDTNTTKHQFTIVNNVPTGGTGGIFTIKITVSGTNGTTTKTLTGILSSSAVSGSGYASSIQLLSGSPSNTTISVKGTGATETSTMSFVVKDSAGNAITAARAATVAFKFAGDSLGGGEFISPASVTTDANGKVTTTVNAGTKSGVLQVIASTTVNGKVITSSPVPLTIASGLADSSHFTAWITTNGIPVVNLPGSQEGVAIYNANVQIGDMYGNPVQANTAVYFTTNSGIITSTGLTDATGHLSPSTPVIGYGGNPRPSSGIDTIIVSTSGQNYPIKKILTLLYTGYPIITQTPTTLGTISAGNSLIVKYKVADVNGNPLAGGNTLAVTASGAVASYASLSGDVLVTTKDTKDTSTTWHQFTVTNVVPNGGAGGAFSITITVNGPNGSASQTLTGTLTAPQSSTQSAVTGTVSYNGQAVRGIKVADKNSVTALATYTDASGNFSLTYQLTSSYSPLLVFTDSTLTYAADTVSSITLTPGNSQTVNVSLTKNATNIRTANQVSTLSISTNHIYSKGVGVLEGNSQLENCKYVLQVKDSAGVAIAATPSYQARFSLLFYPASGATGSAPSVNPDSEWTDENGQLPVTIAAGTCPGTVQLIVTVDLGSGKTFQTYITRINIFSGFADQAHFNLAPEETYPNGWVIPYWGLYGQPHIYDAVVADTFGYAVPSGQSVIFNTTDGVGVIGNSGITTTDANGYARVTWLTGTPTPSENGFYTITDPLTNGRKGYVWMHAETIGKNGAYIQDSILILWNEGAAITNSPDPITMAHGTSSGLIDTLKLYDSNMNPINASITASVNLGSNPPQGESFMVYGDISSDPSSVPLVTPAGDYRLQGRGNTYFLFGIADQSTITVSGSIIINIYITIANHQQVHVQVPVTVN